MGCYNSWITEQAKQAQPQGSKGYRLHLMLLLIFFSQLQRDKKTEEGEKEYKETQNQQKGRK